ncbi:MAG: mevalonate kinase [Chloroflexi bacterium RBG_19FT_COMBO_56_12]|nr:MAG: mevalonate kinase [Chloroflexi bacterium RBG_19FT_COMBO_56_12]
MPAFSASAPGKIILFGEHAVVYNRPAIAVPVEQVSAKAIVTADLRGTAGSVKILAPDVGLETQLSDLSPTHPLAAAINSTTSALGVSRIPACTIKITSTIPVAAGLGSGAAVTVAILRALSAYLGHPLPDEQVCQLAYEVEKIHHGTPSGIDNTVVTYARPVYFIKDQPIEQLHPRLPFTIVIGDTGIQSPTAVAVGDVRKAWQQRKDEYEALFDSTGAIAVSARAVIEGGMTELLGPLMDANHGLLRKIGVSCPELDLLVQAARSAGALGAKLSGGGRGGNMIALVTPNSADKVAAALETAGAVRTIITQIRG